MVSARALARVVASRKASGEEPLTFGMTFPFSTHNYHLRFWMAAGGVDPDEDVRLVVLPPPYMVESLANKHVDGFCVGAPWNSVAVDLGIGFILHFVSEILARAAEKVLGVRTSWAQENPDLLQRLVRAHRRAAAFMSRTSPTATRSPRMLAAPNRIGVAPEVIRRTLDGRLKVAPDGTTRVERALSAGRPRGRRASRSGAGRLALCADGALGSGAAFARAAGGRQGGVPAGPLRRGARGGDPVTTGEPADGIGAFAGPAFDPDDIARHLAAWEIKRPYQG